MTRPPPPPQGLATIDPQGLALIFIPAGGGPLPPGPPSPPLDPLPPSPLDPPPLPWTPSPPPPSAQVYPKTWVLGTFFSHGKKTFGAFGACHTLCIYWSMCAPYTLFSRLPCPNARCQCISAPRSHRCHTQNVKT